jgi:FMN phosphatase YigB (HAD superfamily)
MFSLFRRKGRTKQLDLDSIQAVFFDLDGTLVDVDMHRFVPSYLLRLTEQMGDQVDPARATRALHRAVAAMFANADADKTLECILLEVLQSELSMSPGAYAASLERFCRKDLESLRPLVSGHPLSPRLVEASLERGWQVVLATNPIFPRAVIDARIAWGALDGGAFHHVTAYETAHFCKPNPGFFEELLARLQIPAAACLMIGNDTLHDLAACQVGMQTGLLTPWRIHRPDAHFTADWQGSHEELLAMIAANGCMTRQRAGCPD